jgi:hypothetical protein
MAKADGKIHDDDDDQPPLPGARYHDLAGTLGRKGNPLGWVLGVVAGVGVELRRDPQGLRR